MVHKQIEEKLEIFDQEISGMRTKLHKSLAIEVNLMSLSKSIDRLVMQAKKEHQSLLKYVESKAKEKSMMSEGLIVYVSQGSVMTKATKEGNSLMKKSEVKHERRKQKLMKT
ncbi:histone-lysine N-methyltransferase ASHR1 isoform X1 [Cucumis melo var. makuwa]|uniref:Histone-lysine N-methyltransferase ASHR1 isoform X1 n=1 Tax=Cucumis melo var. makuwa TaxID=1194695 RepID=A0A5D3DZG3_CUCMM|nr:histone-lysine N-methyltransferase ASHR1 isoform X1 [Cucumis melo var. makuwa]TYK29153.1 histone-lysine N-methyltransferase ASHR1 isoform X1 [Cucumis melo var. makuwa]